MKYIVGAYVTCPCLWEWDEGLADRYWDGIKSIGAIRGLEHAFWGKLHPFDDDWFLKMLNPDWDVVVTCIPGNMARMKANPRFGLASTDEEGRKEAIAFTEDALMSVRRINQSQGRQSVIGIQLHSAPRAIDETFSSQEAFERSLEEIGQWDWEGARLTIEHCDAARGGKKPEKGFLPLSEELEVMTRLEAKTGVKWGVVINWGRSALEGHSDLTPVEHLKMAQDQNRLAGLMFSGASDKESPWGVWADTHMPPPPEEGREGAEGSLMNRKSMGASISSCDLSKLDYCGIKIMDLPNNSSVERRVSLNSDCLSLLDELIEKGH